LEQFLELGAGGSRHLDRDFRDRRCGANAPAFELADQVQRRSRWVIERDARLATTGRATAEDPAAARNWGWLPACRWLIHAQRRWRCSATEQATCPPSGRRYGRRAAPCGWHGGGLHQEHFVELPTGVGELWTQPLPSRVLVFTGLGLQVFQTTQVNGDLAPRAEPQDALLHRSFAKPRDAVLARRTRLLQLAQQLADRRVISGRFEHEVFKILGDEEIVDQRFFDTLGDLCALLLQTLDAELALGWIGKVPAMQHGEAVEALLQDVAQFPLVLGVELLVLGALAAPFLRLHFSAGQDQQVAVLEGIRRPGARQQ